MALTLREWLPDVINRVEPFVSSKDIDPGSRWQTEIAGELAVTSYGIVCVTRDNQHAPWLNFEAGALAKAVESSHVVPLAVDLKPSDIEPPLGHFQAQPASEDGIREIVRSVNAACEPPLEDGRLAKSFSKWWPDLAAKLESIEETTPASAEDARSERDLLEETLDIVRSLARSQVSLGNVERHVVFDNGLDYADVFALGRRVRHASFGEGEVVGREPDGVVIIHFDDDTERKLAAHIAPLTLYDDDPSLSPLSDAAAPNHAKLA